MRIGIVAQKSNDIFGVHENYMSLAENFGTPVVLCPVDKYLFLKTYKIDALILPGGSDVDSKRYSKLPSFMCYRPDVYLEYFDTQILSQYAGVIPIFGICRGLQTLNVYFGGTLYQHLFRHPISSHDEDLVHSVDIPGYGRNNTMYKNYKVNSFHHQAIKRLGNGLESIAVSDDGIIEAIKYKGLPISAVQWHPERILDAFSLKLIKETFGI